MKELKKTIQNLKMEIKNNKEITKGANTGVRKPRKRQGVRDASITKRIQEIEKRISGVEDTIENIDTTKDSCPTSSWGSFWSAPPLRHLQHDLGGGP